MKTARGYTVIEVMMALAVLAVGATGVIALQKVALIGNTNARLGDGARQVASTWAERLKSDAIQWNDPMGTFDIVDTQFLNLAGEYNGQPQPAWKLAPEVVGTRTSPVADIHGVDVLQTDAPEVGVFCTHLLLGKDIDKPFDLTVSGNPHKIAIRATIRVVWRQDLGPMLECRTAPPEDIEQNDSKYGFYYLSTVIRQDEASL